MATEVLEPTFEITSAWLIWMLPFAAALIMPGIGKLSKKCNKVMLQLDLL